MILDKKIDETLHLCSKTLAKVLENESNDGKPKLSFDATSEPVTFEMVNFNYLEGPYCFDHSKEPPYFDFSDEFPIVSFESKQDDCESCDSEINVHFAYQLLEDESDIDHHFRYQLLEKDPEEDVIQSSKVVGSLCGQSQRSNACVTPSKELSLSNNYIIKK